MKHHNIATQLVALLATILGFRSTSAGQLPRTTNKTACVRLAATAIVSLASIAEIRAEEIAVSGEIVGFEVVDPGEFTITPGGIVIARGVGDETLTGDLAGTMRVTSTLIVNINTGEGILFGTIDWKDPNSDGGFRGPFFGQVSGVFGPGPGEFDGQWQLRGYGARLGETALIDNFGPLSLPQVYEGVIRVPSGH